MNVTRNVIKIDLFSSVTHLLLFTFAQIYTDRVQADSETYKSTTYFHNFVTVCPPHFLCSMVVPKLCISDEELL